MTPESDRNLLFGVLAMQLELLSEQQFAEICASLSTRRETPFADLLAERGWLNDEDRHQIEQLVDRKLHRHRGDVRASLVEASSSGNNDWDAIVEDRQLRKSLGSGAQPHPPTSRYVGTLVIAAVLLSMTTIGAGVLLVQLRQANLRLKSELASTMEDREHADNHKLIAERVRDKAQEERDKANHARARALESEGTARLRLGILSGEGERPSFTERSSEAEALAALEQSLAIRKALAEEEPLSTDYASAVAETHYYLGLHYKAAEDSPNATEQFQQATDIWSRLANENPEDAEQTINLARTHYEMGALHRQAQQYESAMEWYEKGITTADAATSDADAEGPLQEILAKLLIGRASMLGKLDRSGEAIELWDRVIELVTGPRELEIRLERAITRAAAGDHAKAASEAAELSQGSDLTADTLFSIATVFAKAAAAVDDDNELADEERALRKLGYSDKAVGALNRAVDEGMFSDLVGDPILSSTMATYLRTDAAFKALKEHDGFKKFVDRVEGVLPERDPSFR